MRVEGRVRVLIYGLMAGNLSALVLAGISELSLPCLYIIQVNENVNLNH